MKFLLVSDPSDPRIGDYRNIPDPELIQQRGIFVAEGRLVVRRLITGGRYPVRSAMVTEAARASLIDLRPARPELTVYVVTPDLMNGITGFNIHRGCLAIGERGPAAAWTDLLSTPNSQIPNPKLILMLERIANADNVGGIFRNAAAFGVDAVLLDESTTDPLYRKALRTSMGASLSIPFARANSLPGIISELRREGFATVAFTPSATATPLTSVVRAVSGRPAVLVLGHEGEGLSPDTLQACEFHARIVTSSAVDSLNVASAAAIGLHELTQDRADGSGHRPR